MKVSYVIRFDFEDDFIFVDVPDCLGCQTFAIDKVEADKLITEALLGWCEAEIEAGRSLPVPTYGVYNPAARWVTVEVPGDHA